MPFDQYWLIPPSPIHAFRLGRLRRTNAGPSGARQVTPGWRYPHLTLGLQLLQSELINKSTIS